MRAKHRRTFDAIMAVPTRSNIIFSDQYLHRPHPGKEAKRYQVEQVREWLAELEVKP